MKALKGLMVYIGIILGSVVGLALILLCIMYFVPSFRIAGVGFVHSNKVIEGESIELRDYSNDELVLNISSKKINIKICPVDDDKITYNLKLNVFGITTEIVEYKVIEQNELNENGVLEVFFNITEPNGWISCDNSYLQINVPNYKTIGIVSNTRNGDVSIGDEQLPIKLSSLNITTNKGNLNLINIGSGVEEKNLTLNSLNLTTENGTFDFRNISSLSVLNKVRLKAEDGKFIFNKLYASVDITGQGVSIEAEQISCGENGFSFVAKNGSFKIKNLSSPIGAENTIIVDNLYSFDINEISGKTGIVTNYGNINVNLLRDYTVIENENGNVSVKTANSTLIITTHLGSINVDGYYATGKFKSEKGSISVNSKSDFVDEYYTQINSVDGNVTIYNKVNRLILTTTGRADVNVTFGEIKEGKVFQHKVNTSTLGNAIVYMPTVNVPAYSFVAKGIISGEIGILISANEGTQYFPDASYKNEAVNNACFEFVGRIEFKGYTQLTN